MSLLSLHMSVWFFRLRAGLFWLMFVIGLPIDMPLQVFGQSFGPSSFRAPESAMGALERYKASVPVFVQNQGQWPNTSAFFVLSSPGVNVALTKDGIRIRLYDRKLDSPANTKAPTPGIAAPLQQETKGDTLADLTHDPPASARERSRFRELLIRFQGASAIAAKGLEKSSQVFHYHQGIESTWKENVPSWKSVICTNLYEGIDLLLLGKSTGMKLEFRLAAGIDPSRIQISYDGIERLELAQDNGLMIHLGANWRPIMDAPPAIYQEIDGQRHDVEGRFRLITQQSVSFDVSKNYDHSRPLVIDPFLAWPSDLCCDSN